MIPREVDVNQIWTAQMNYEQDMSDARAKGLLYVGVISAHSNREFNSGAPREKDEPSDKDNGGVAQPSLAEAKMRSIGMKP
jgi:hypothetical protein